MAMQPLATPEDAEAFGNGEVTAPFLAKASARAREFTKQTISAGTSTVRASGPKILLPQRPLRRVLEVTDEATGKPVQFARGNGSIIHVATGGYCLVTYEHGFDPVPEGVIELICEIAARLQSINPALRAGMQQGTAGSESASFGWDSHNGVAGLTSAEKDRLRALFPAQVRTIVTRA